MLFIQRYWKKIVIAYLVVGVFFSLTQRGLGGLNPFSIDNLLNVLLWLPLIVLHFFLFFLLLFVIACVAVYLVGLRVPAVGIFVANILARLGIK